MIIDFYQLPNYYNILCNKTTNLVKTTCILIHDKKVFCFGVDSHKRHENTHERSFYNHEQQSFKYRISSYALRYKYIYIYTYV